MQLHPALQVSEHAVYVQPVEQIDVVGQTSASSATLWSVGELRRANVCLLSVSLFVVAIEAVLPIE